MAVAVLTLGACGSAPAVVTPSAETAPVAASSGAVPAAGSQRSGAASGSMPSAAAVTLSGIELPGGLRAKRRSRLLVAGTAGAAQTLRVRVVALGPAADRCDDPAADVVARSTKATVTGTAFTARVRLRAPARGFVVLCARATDPKTGETLATVSTPYPVR